MSCSSSLLERFAVQRIGQIEIAEDMAVARRHGHTEESLHRRMVGRKAGRRRVLGQVVDAQRRALADDFTEHAQATGLRSRWPHVGHGRRRR